MDRKRDTSLKDALKSDEAFFEFLKQDANSDEYRRMKRRVEKKGLIRQMTYCTIMFWAGWMNRMPKW